MLHFHPCPLLARSMSSSVSSSRLRYTQAQRSVGRLEPAEAPRQKVLERTYEKGHLEASDTRHSWRESPRVWASATVISHKNASARPPNGHEGSGPIPEL